MVKITKRGKIALGVTAMVLCLVLVVTMVVVAVVESMTRTEIYGRQYSYVDDAMYDGAYVAAKSGGFDLMKGDTALTNKTFGSLRYYEKNLFLYTEYSGGWGFITTAGDTFRSYPKNSYALKKYGVTYMTYLEDGGYSVRYGKKNVGVPATDTIFTESKLLEEIEGCDLSGFYDAAPEGVFLSLSGATNKIKITDVTSGESVEFFPSEVDGFTDGYFTVGRLEESGTAFTTYALSTMKKVDELDGYTVTPSLKSYSVAGGKLVRYDVAAGKTTAAGGFGSVEFPVSDVKVTAVEGNKLLARSESEDYYYDGATLRGGEFSPLSVSGAIGVFDLGGSYVALDSSLGVLGTFSAEPQVLTMYKTEKDVVTRSVEYNYFLVDGKLYRPSPAGALTVFAEIDPLTDVYTTSEGESRLITDVGVFDASLTAVFVPAREFVTLSAVKTADGEYEDAFEYTNADGKKYLYGTSEFEIAADAEMTVTKGTSLKGAQRVVFKKSNSDGSCKFYSGGGAQILTFDHDVTDGKLYYNGDSYVFTADGRAYISLKGSAVDGVWDAIYVHPRLTSMVLVKGGYLRTVRPDYHGTLLEEMYFSGEVEVEPISEYGYLFKDKATGFMGIIDSKGSIKCRAAYRTIELSNSYAVASLDNEHFTLIKYSGESYGGVYKKYVAINDYALMYADDGIGVLLDDSGVAVISNIYGEPQHIVQYAYSAKEEKMLEMTLGDCDNLYLKFNSSNIIKILRIPTVDLRIF